METASSLPIHTAFEPLGTGLAGLVAAGAIQAAAELAEVVDVGGEEGPDTGGEEQPDHQPQAPVTRPATAVGLPPVGPDEPTRRKTRATRPRRAPRGANRINTTRTTGRPRRRPGRRCPCRCVGAGPSERPRNPTRQEGVAGWLQCVRRLLALELGSPSHPVLSGRGPFGVGSSWPVTNRPAGHGKADTSLDLLHAIYGPALSRPIWLSTCGCACPLGTVIDRC
jgi:hypothetical protein